MKNSIDINKQQLKNIKKPQKSYHIVTFGCQMNENDSEKLAGMLEQMGYTKNDEMNSSDIIIINTCSVRQTADQRAFGNIGAIKTLKRKNPDLILAVCGCMMQQEENVNYLLDKHPEVDIIFGTHNLNKFPQILTNFQTTHERIVDITDKESDFDETVPVSHKFPFKSYVTIMQGCNNFCTYCIVPYVRGRERSRNPEDIIKEVTELAQSGTKEVTLLGQNVNSYGNDLAEDINFPNLLKELNKIEDLERIRFMSSNPKDFTDNLIAAIRDLDKVMPAIHLALQSGSSRILSKMNRHYTKEEAIELVKKIKKEIPGIAITTDIIVGFPGETEEDFQDTLDLVEQAQFDNAFSFIYSKRPGTIAADMEDQIDEEVKHERITRLLDKLKELAQNQNDHYQDKIEKVLVEEVSQKDKSKLSGRTETNKLVHFEGSQDLIGEIVSVKINKPGPYSMIGTLVEE